MHRQAANVMKHLETKREAAERRRVALMSQGIARFLERTSRESYLGLIDTSVQDDESRDERFPSDDEEKNYETQNRTGPNHLEISTQDKESVLDKIKTALDHAAEILRESLE
jgi:hypothetical protein